MLEFILSVVMTASGFAVGAYVGIINERRAAERSAERLRRLDPPRRTAGSPANMEAPPSDVNSPKWRSGIFKSGPPHE